MALKSELATKDSVKSHLYYCEQIINIGQILMMPGQDKEESFSPLNADFH